MTKCLLFRSKKIPSKYMGLVHCLLKEDLIKIGSFFFYLVKKYLKNIYIKIFEFEIFFGYDNIKTKGGK